MLCKQSGFTINKLLKNKHITGIRHLPTFQVPATIILQISYTVLLGVVSSYITVHFYKYAENINALYQKVPVLNW